MVCGCVNHNFGLLFTFVLNMNLNPKVIFICECQDVIKYIDEKCKMGVKMTFRGIN